LLSFLQYYHLIQGVGSYTAENIGTGIQDVLICFEMFIYSLFHMWVFDYQPFNKEQDKKPFVRKLLDGEIRSATIPLLTNFKDTVNPQHDLLHTRETFTPAAEKMKDILKSASDSFNRSRQPETFSINLP